MIYINFAGCRLVREMADTYKKNKGLEGIHFQLDLVTAALVNALHNHQGWRISAENKEAGKYDDIVIKLPDASAVLIQAKHKDKKITKQQPLSRNSKNADFSLPKYFFRSRISFKHERLL